MPTLKYLKKIARYTQNLKPTIFITFISQTVCLFKNMYLKPYM